jgi:hypothetical protein
MASTSVEAVARAPAAVVTDATACGRGSFRFPLSKSRNDARDQDYDEDRQKNGHDTFPLVAAATTAAAAAASAAGEGWAFGRAAVGVGCGEDGELDLVLFAGALGAGDFLLFIDYDFFEGGFAVFADVFVDGHGVSFVG